MRLVTYRRAGGENRAGVVVGERIVDLAEGAAAIGETLPGDIVGLLTLEEAGLAVAGRVAERAASSELPGVALDGADLGPVIPQPPTLLLLAGNYQSHIMEGGGQGVDKAKITPRFFIKPRTSVIGTGDAIEIPSVSNKVDYELEIAAVIGKRGKSIPLAQAEEHVAGYAVFNDISARELTIAEGRSTRPMDDFFDWLNGKWCDTFAALGPYLVTRDEIGDPKALEMSLKVNGQLRQHSAAGEMIFDVPESIAFISQFITLEPGDLICMGTPGGVGDTTQTYLQPGDLVEAEIEKLGRLVNTVR
jgi:2-keto-4-pentenoate hydratase/2-oxohepta-3-ene-1,7-dioic acid hydratase in catechol pathway